MPGTQRTRLYALDVETGASQPVDRRRGKPESMTWSGPYLIYTYSSTLDDALLLMRWDSRTGERTRSDRSGVDRFYESKATISAPGCTG